MFNRWTGPGWSSSRLPLTSTFCANSNIHHNVSHVWHECEGCLKLTWPVRMDTSSQLLLFVLFCLLGPNKSFPQRWKSLAFPIKHQLLMTTKLVFKLLLTQWRFLFYWTSQTFILKSYGSQAQCSETKLHHCSFWSFGVSLSVTNTCPVTQLWRIKWGGLQRDSFTESSFSIPSIIETWTTDQFTSKCCITSYWASNLKADCKRQLLNNSLFVFIWLPFGWNCPKTPGSRRGSKSTAPRGHLCPPCHPPGPPCKKPGAGSRSLPSWCKSWCKCCRSHRSWLLPGPDTNGQEWGEVRAVSCQMGKTARERLKSAASCKNAQSNADQSAILKPTWVWPQLWMTTLGAWKGTWGS